MDSLGYHPWGTHTLRLSRQNILSIVTSVVVWFAMNPDEELTSADIGIKWDVDPNNIGKSLRIAHKNGWLVRQRKVESSPVRLWRWYYTAGPRLLKEIGKG